MKKKRAWCYVFWRKVILATWTFMWQSKVCGYSASFNLTYCYCACVMSALGFHLVSFKKKNWKKKKKKLKKRQAVRKIEIKKWKRIKWKQCKNKKQMNQIKKNDNKTKMRKKHKQKGQLKNTSHVSSRPS